jgi:hypothetical protein
LAFASILRTLTHGSPERERRIAPFDWPPWPKPHRGCLDRAEMDILWTRLRQHLNVKTAGGYGSRLRPNWSRQRNSTCALLNTCS